MTLKTFRYTHLHIPIDECVLRCQFLLCGKLLPEYERKPISSNFYYRFFYSDFYSTFVQLYHSSLFNKISSKGKVYVNHLPFLFEGPYWVCL